MSKPASADNRKNPSVGIRLLRASLAMRARWANTVAPSTTSMAWAFCRTASLMANATSSGPSTVGSVEKVNTKQPGRGVFERHRLTQRSTQEGQAREPGNTLGQQLPPLRVQAWHGHG